MSAKEGLLIRDGLPPPWSDAKPGRPLVSTAQISILLIYRMKNLFFCHIEESSRNLNGLSWLKYSGDVPSSRYE